MKVSYQTVVLALLATAKGFPHTSQPLNATTLVDADEEGFPVIADLPPVPSSVGSENLLAPLATRALIKGHSCSVGRPAVQIGNAKQVVDFYRNGASGKCTLEGNSCKMLTCISKVGVFWCNQNEWTIARDCKDFGDHLQYIVDNCNKRPSLPNHQWIKGIVEDKDGYTIEMASVKGKAEISECKGKPKGW